MTDLKIRTKIAEILGWKPDDDGAGLNTWEASWAGNKLYGLKPRFDDSGKLVSYTVDCVVPNFPEDLNACHEFEKAKLTTISLVTDYGIRLANIMHRDHNHHPRIADTGWKLPVVGNCNWCATARQRCEAFLRVYNQWEE